MFFILKQKYLPVTKDTEDKTSNPTLLTEPSTAYWEFGLVGASVKARAIGAVPHASLAKGAFGAGNAAPGTVLDVTSAFPAWVKKVLTEQAVAGLKFQQRALGSPTGFTAFNYELGYGNCHGFTFHLFELFESAPLTEWQIYKQGQSNEVVTTAPPGVPTVFGKFAPRYQVVNVYTNKEASKPLKTRGVQDRYSRPGGVQWAGIIDIGKNLVVQKIHERGGMAVTTPQFGDLGFKKESFDHTAIALGTRGSSHVYVLQKDSPMNPYFISLNRIEQFDWYRR
jgi:hypothetical protein